MSTEPIAMPADETEHCARVCEEVSTWAGSTWRNAALECAALIRKRRGSATPAGDLPRLVTVQHNALRVAQHALQQHQAPQAWPFQVKQDDTAALAAVAAALSLYPAQGLPPAGG